MGIVVLEGCTPEPLGSYLKALAVLRLVAEQKDARARGSWGDDDVFRLESSLDEAGLVRFFVEEYRPSPIVAPWNGGSGFYEGDAMEGRLGIERSIDPRFMAYREVIATIQRWPEMPPTAQPLGALIEAVERAASAAAGKASKELNQLVTDVRRGCTEVRPALTHDPLERPYEALEEAGQSLTGVAAATMQTLQKAARKLRTAANKEYRSAGKERLVRVCRERLPDVALDWIDCAVLLDNAGELAYPPLLGVAGGEGRLDYTNAFMTRVAELLLSSNAHDATTALVRNALFAASVGDLKEASVGQHNPGRAGGFNQGPGIEVDKVPSNPWNFVLTLEGAIAWSSAMARRQASSGVTSLSSPFTVRASAVGNAMPSEKDAASARAEVWAPLWSGATSYGELRAFIGEGRAEFEGRSARSSIEFATAVASLGVDRGVKTFVRYSLVKRRGDSYIALPAGRVPVTERRESDLVRELMPLLERVDGLIRHYGDAAPARLLAARRRVDGAVYELLLHEGAVYVAAVLAAIGQLERVLARHDSKLRPVSGLHPRWVRHADDGSLDLRVAAALASMASRGGVGPLRANLAPVDPEEPRRWASGAAQWVRATHGGLPGWMAAALGRRMMDAQRYECFHNPLYSPLALEPEDVAAFIAGAIDDARAEALLWGLGWVQWDRWDGQDPDCRELWGRWRTPVEEIPRPVPRDYAQLKLLFLPQDLKVGGKEVKIRAEPRVVQLVRAGRVHDAVEVAQRRLYASGLAPVRVGMPDRVGGALRLAAGLLVPVRANGIVALALAPEGRESASSDD